MTDRTITLLLTDNDMIEIAEQINNWDDLWGAIGYLSASAAFGQSPSGIKRQEIRDLITPPWKSDDLSAALGITVSEDERHTALGDARWAMRIYDAVMGGPS